ncbi:hypothetical protein NBRC3257_0290 [Gluconobacter thailandicus NBRC 3257]|uniref:Transposase n=1 Tax=Gluconobacter thailandicus NBRC 3257 TaxID=1381097 RepID=A0ABQ0ISY1_GLUTH|nr:hypothetical protein NBRC3255_2698 [Gluconobacter thailandicus NBRC 3255]GAD25291.1 hypothetical protein NBRC3257_0290 [Gluconobacter thailandicus NBRC 3257]
MEVNICEYVRLDLISGGNVLSGMIDATGIVRKSMPKAI